MDWLEDRAGVLMEWEMLCEDRKDASVEPVHHEAKTVTGRFIP